MTLTDYHGFIRPNGPKGTNATNDHSQIQYLLALALLANNPAIDYFHFI
jgi:2-methylcitrate dehydratase PrpD